MTASTSTESRVDRLHRPGLVDMHFDLPLDLYDQRQRTGILVEDFLADLRAGGLGVLGVAIYLEDKHLPEMGLRVALDQVARLYAEVDRSPQFAICRSAAEIAAARAADQIALLITMEGVEPLGTDLDFLRVFYELGLRSVGLTHMRRNAAGDGGVFAPSGSSPAGLSAFGKRVVQECQRLGILLDLAHLNPAGVEDVLSLTSGPIVISHTNPRHYHDLERNSSDAQIKAVGATRRRHRRQRSACSAPSRESDARSLCRPHRVHCRSGRHRQRGTRLRLHRVSLRRWTPAERAALEALTTATHAAPDLVHHGQARNLTRKLIERGFSDGEIEKVLYGNWLRVIAEVLR